MHGEREDGDDMEMRVNPYFQTELGQLFNGSALDSLRQLPDEFAQSCVTSPPYWGLRDYGVDGQIGLERTPEEYVSSLLEVFREVRRVLRKDGTLWLNLGASYSNSNGGRSWELNASRGHADNLGKIGRIKHGDSCGKSPSRSPLLQRVPACDTDGKGSQDFQDVDRACPCSCDGPQDEIQNHRGCSAHTALSASQVERQTSQTGHDNGHSGCDQEPPDSSLPGAQASTKQRSSGQPLDASGPEGGASVCQQGIQTFSDDAHQSADTSACTSGTSQMSPPLVVRTVGKESFFSACGKSSCKGIGNCGLCWASLAIPSLNVKQKDLVSIPQLVAFALQSDGWWLRSDIIWAKQNPMPESVTDRPTKAHEYIFLLTKSERYFFDQDAVKESFKSKPTPRRYSTTVRSMQAKAMNTGVQYNDEMRCTYGDDGRNIRSVWALPTIPYPEAHFATFPQSIPERCIKAGTREGDTVLDPFFGAGTVGLVAEKLKRRWIGIELNEKYCDLARARVEKFLWGETEPGQERLFEPMRQESLL